MSNISTRVAKLESAHGGNDFERWLRTASEQEINQRLIELMAKADPDNTVDWAALSPEEMNETARKFLEL